VFEACRVEVEFVKVSVEDAHREGIEKLVGEDQRAFVGGGEGLGERAMPGALVSLLLSGREVGGNFDEMIVQFSSGQESEGVTDVAGEGPVARAQFDHGERRAMSFPAFLEPASDPFSEARGEFRDGGEIAACPQLGAWAGIVAAWPIEGGGHEAVEADELSFRAVRVASHSP